MSAEHAELFWLDDDEYLAAWFENDYLFVQPCGLDAVMFTPDQQRRLRALLPGETPGQEGSTGLVGLTPEAAEEFFDR